MPLPRAFRAAFPDAKTLYDILRCAATATAGELKKAYYKAALQYHPDKAGQDASATQRFQCLSVAHGILSDAARRREYDETGEVDEGGDGGGGGGGSGGASSASFASSYAYWRAQFPGFSAADIDSFAQGYRGGAEEAEDVLAAYEECRGDMDSMLQCVPCCQDDDEDRFVALCHAAIADGRAQPHKAFVALYGASAAAAAAGVGAGEGGEGSGGGGAGASAAAGSGRGGSRAQKKAREAAGGAGAGAAAKVAAAKASRAARAAAEAAEAEEYLTKLKKEHAKKTGGSVGDASLEAMLRSRAEERSAGTGGFLASLESKYGGRDKKAAAALEDVKPSKRGKK